MMGSMSINAKLITLLGISLTLLPACQSTIEKNVSERRSTLADLAAEQVANELKKQSDIAEVTAEGIANNTAVMSKAQRSAKLADLYQSILTLEPNQEVRTKIAYRLVQIDTQAYDQQDDAPAQADNSSQALTALVASYKALLTRFPNRAENEEIQYQLAKALSLQGKLDESLMQIESLLAKYPHSNYAAELNFRRGDIYYNLQYYTKALIAYQAVLQSKNSNEYYVNSVYMSGWTLFKLNRLSEADGTFLTLLDYIVAQEKVQPYRDSFSFSSLDNRYVSLVSDIQRVLSVSLSQQQQEKSLVALVKTHEQSHKKQQKYSYLYLYRHVLFKNLVDFLLENGLKHDAELTYQAYITMEPNNIWAARYSLALIDLYHQQGKNQAVKALKIQYVQQYGLQSEFWQQAMFAGRAEIVNEALLMSEILPNLLTFSYQHSRYLYAQAQSEKDVTARIQAFSNTAQWLSNYLSLAKMPQAKQLVGKLELSQGLLADELLFADASFEAQQYQQALDSYEYIAYQAPTISHDLNSLRKEAAYATTLTIREMLSVHLKAKSKIANATASTIDNREGIVEDSTKDSTEHRDIEHTLLLTRSRLDKTYIERYPDDEKSLTLAVQQAQYSFENKNNDMLQYYSNFILQTHGVIAPTVAKGKVSKTPINHNAISAKLNPKARKEIQIASQLRANSLYQQSHYVQSEEAYNLALNYVVVNSDFWLKMRELLAASIYFQGRNLVVSQPLLAVEHYLRLGKQVPESSYRLNAQFDAANLLLAEQQWQQAIDVFLAFQKRYPKHDYSRSIPAKLAQSYEQLQLWQMAATQYLVIVDLAEAESTELKREALYSAAELFLKANNIVKAISTFRTYAHAYPEPFDIAQEVRFKMSGFYQQTKEPNKQYYWYRKIINFHEQKFTSPTEKVNPRAVYLASVAALGLGEAHQQTFKQNKLTLPLNKSLARKQKAMKLAIGYYKKLLSFQLAEFVPHGTFNLAQMYRQLGQDVMSSQRPQDLDELALEEYDLLLEEIAYPFEEKAIEIHTNNAQRAWQNIYDNWVEKSFAALAELEPALYDRSYNPKLTNKADKKEHIVDAVRTLH